MATSAQSMFSALRVTRAAHLDDVAKVHVRALDPKVEGDRNYGVSVPMQYNDAIDIARKNFRDAFEKGVLKPGNQPSEVVEWDARGTESAFGIKFKGFEEMVVDVVS